MNATCKGQQTQRLEPHAAMPVSGAERKAPRESGAEPRQSKLGLRLLRTITTTKTTKSSVVPFAL